MNVYFDTEFTDFLVDPSLISIGMVTNDGREFYAEMNDTYEEAMCSWFVIENVLPILWGKDFEMSIDDIAIRLKAWVESLDDSVTLFSDAPRYDWAWVLDIFDRGSCGWPENLVRNCRNTIDLANDDERLLYNYAYEEFWRLPANTNSVRHHALWDARCIRHAHRSSRLDGRNNTGGI